MGVCVGTPKLRHAFTPFARTVGSVPGLLFTMEIWTENEQKFLEMMKKTRDYNALKELADKLKAPNAIHLWREADFTLLFHASIENNPVALQLLLEKGADPRKSNNRGTNVLMLMMKRSQLEMSDMCLAKLPNESERKAFVNSKTEPGWTSLMTAAENTQVEAARWLIKNGANVNAAMTTGWTAGHAAAKKGNLEILKMLMDAGADKHILAAHREFGKNLQLEDVTVQQEVQDLLAKYP